MSMGSFLDKVAGAKASTHSKQGETKATEVHIPAPTTRSTLPLTKTVVAVAVVGASFYAGLAYQKAQQSNSTSTLSTNGSSSQSQNQSSGTNGGVSSNGGYGGFGRASMSTSQVTAISSSSITAKDSSGNSATYSITSDTLITDSGQLVAASDIQTGDSVLVIPSRNDTSTARRIIVNPDFGQDQSNNQPETIDPNQTQVN